jgi:(1->4)-alpha-D-glucan 1-alpha-D-glucosylmutase
MFGQHAKRIPVATYRLQLRREFPLEAATALVPYAQRLGISDFYTSPVFLSTPGSSHGYDVNDYRQIDPELGGRAALQALHQALQARGLGLLLDFVPNHMGINGPGLLNTWWRDVLENGEYSRYAGFFDIDWNGGGEERGQVMVPILEDHYGRVLEQGRLSLVYDAPTLGIAYGEMRFPVRPSTYALVLEAVAAAAPAPDLQALARDFASLPKDDAVTDAETARQRAQLLDELKQQLAALLEREPSVRHQLAAQLARINGDPSHPESFDALDRLIARQHYRLAYWRAAVHEINYRRFFAIDTLIGLRMEVPEVFAETHALLGELLAAGVVTGLRIDHVDGLRQPQQYLERLQLLANRREGDPAEPLYVVVEKILGDHETLPDEWATHGTTGYEFIRQLAGVLVNAPAARWFDRTYREFGVDDAGYERTEYEKKRLVLDELFANAVVRLAAQLADLLQIDRRWRDLTRHELTVAVREVIAGHGVYRTYRRGPEPMTPRDQRVVEQACALAIARNPRLGQDVFELLRDVLTGAYPAPAAAPFLRRRLASWVLTFQQYTGAVMAKAVEDTAFYTYSRFIALNEVGGNPGHFGGTVAAFHAANAERMRRTPHALLATATHDTKLGEDARARLYALSEIPHEWRDCVAEWRELNARHKTNLDGRAAPDPNEEYRLYQVLLAAWPPDDRIDDTFRERLREHLRKAMNEARRNTSWVQPNDRWIEAGARFVDRILDADTGREFLASFQPRADRVAHLGMVNSLTQVVLKATSPGVPDFYQGAELWDLSLVDPDNRRPVDFAVREALVATDQPTRRWCELLRNWRDGEVKLQVTRALLRFRGAHRDVFQQGAYAPLEVAGRFADHVVAFARTTGRESVVVLVPRLTSRLGCPPLHLVWDDTRVTLPGPGTAWSDVVTGQAHEPGELLLADALIDLPFAVLHGVTA